jgi:hypothetical protein
VSVWQKVQNAGLPMRHALGLWLTHRKLASPGYVPGPQARQALAGKLPYWYVFDFNLAARQTTELRAVTSKNFYLLAVLGNPAPQTTFRAQIFDAKRKKRFSDRGMNDANLVGIAALPFLLREPYQFAPLSPILVRVQNVSNAANAGQIVLYGMVD